MDHQLQAAGDRAGRPRHFDERRRAGLPAKRFFKRFAGFGDVPDQDLELLAAGLRKAMDLAPDSPVPALRAVVHREVARRKRTTRSEGMEELE